MVRLKGDEYGDPVNFTEFQFHMVRLKGKLYLKERERT